MSSHIYIDPSDFSAAGSLEGTFVWKVGRSSYGISLLESLYSNSSRVDMIQSGWWFSHLKKKSPKYSLGKWIQI